MPTTIRSCSFETNSSSAHALCVMTPEQYRAFTEEGMFLSFEAVRDRDVCKYAALDEDGDYKWDATVADMLPFGVSFVDAPTYNSYVLVPADRVDEVLDGYDASAFHAPSYYGETDYWYSHQSAETMSFEDMKHNDWKDQEWPQVEMLPDGNVKLYYSFEV